jgi:hypothetical protein
LRKEITKEDRDVDSLMMEDFDQIVAFWARWWAFVLLCMLTVRNLQNQNFYDPGSSFESVWESTGICEYEYHHNPKK